MKVRDLIAYLQQRKPDAIVAVSSDTEGNSFGTIHERSMDAHGDLVVIYPFHEHIELDEVPAVEVRQNAMLAERER